MSPERSDAVRVRAARRAVLFTYPGVTSLTLGLTGRGIALLCSSVVITLGALAAAGLWPSLWTFLLVVCALLLNGAAAVCEWVAIASKAARIDRSPKAPKWSHLITVAYMGLLLASVLHLRSSYELHTMAQNGMAPTLAQGDVALCAVRGDGDHVEVGDVVGAIISPEAIVGGRDQWVADRGGRLLVVSRIVAAEGDVVRATEGAITVNERPLERGGDGQFWDSVGEERQWTVPAGSYFLAGDGADSGSSASFGLVSRQALTCRVDTIFWSREAGRTGTDVN